MIAVIDPMAANTKLDALRGAFQNAQVEADGEYEFTESSEMLGINVVKQLHVSYRSGNEYLRLDLLLQALGKVGTVVVFEFRGRGQQEQIRIVADVNIAGEIYQLIYSLA